MSVGFPPIPVYPLAIDSDRTLYLVYNTTESVTTADNPPWSEEISIEPVGEDDDEIWAENGFGSINGELFYYDDVETDDNGKVYKLKNCARNLGGSSTRHNASGAEVRGFIVAEHHNQLRLAIESLEGFIGVRNSGNEDTLDYRIRQIADQDDCIDDGNCPTVSFDYDVTDDDPCAGILIEYDLEVDGNFNNFRLDFGDGNFTTSTQPGTHRYPPNVRIDPVVIISNDNCEIVITGVQRENPREPPRRRETRPLEIRIPDVPDLPTIDIGDITVPDTDISIPPTVFPCIDMEPIDISIGDISIGDINVPSMISFIPPNIPSLISITPLSFPTTISIIPPSFPTLSIIPPSFPSISITPPSFPSSLSVVIPSIPNISLIVPSLANISVSVVAPNISVVVPSIPNISIIGTSIPTQISITGPSIPTTITVIGGVNLPSSISITGACDLPSSISITGGVTLPSSISITGNVNIPSSISITGCNIPSTITLSGDLPSTINITGSIPSSITLEGSIPSSIELVGTIPSTINIVAPTFSDINVNWGVAPTVSVNWGVAPTISVSVTCSCACCPSTSPAPFAGAMFDDSAVADVQSVDVDYDFVGIPSKIVLEVPEIPTVKLAHDLPTEIRINKLDLPDKISLVMAERIPGEIKVMNVDVPSIITVETTMPRTITLDASDLPKQISVVNVDIPSVISVEANIPSQIEVIGIPKTISVEGIPDFIRMQADPVELIYKGAPIEMVVKVDMAKVAGETEEGNTCVMIVPCK